LSIFVGSVLRALRKDKEKRTRDEAHINSISDRHDFVSGKIFSSEVDMAVEKHMQNKLLAVPWRET